MSQAPYVLPNFRWGGRMGDSKVVDTMIKDGLSDAFNEYHMGITAENVAEEYGISRDDQDALALESQKRAVAAIESGRFKEEIVPVVIPQRKGDPIVFDTDEFPRKMLVWRVCLSCVLFSKKTVLLQRGMPQVSMTGRRLSWS